MNETQPRLYQELAEWWPLLSAPEDYADEAAFIRETFHALGVGDHQNLLELGSGGGNNASHLKQYFRLTLVDRSPRMLGVSQTLNPECEHVHGDMRTIHLGRQFDGVLVHDAVMYMLTEADLAAAFRTVWEHCRPGGAALFLPDCIRETFTPRTDHGGHDGESRSLRYLEWSYDPDPADDTFVTDFVYMLRSGSEDVQVVYDRHLEGLFSRDFWRKTLMKTGFNVGMLIDPYEREVFTASRPGP